MQKYYFNIKYEFNKETVHKQIARQLKKKNSDYICVADGVILSIANRKPEYLKVVNEGMFSICDSGYVPLYIRWIHGIHYEQYCGSQIFMDIVSSKKYRMFFMGTSKDIGWTEAKSGKNKSCSNGHDFPRITIQKSGGV